MEAADGRHFVSQRKSQENRNIQINYLKHLQRLKYIFKVKNKILNPNLALELTAQRDKQTLYVSMWFFWLPFPPGGVGIKIKLPLEPNCSRIARSRLGILSIKPRKRASGKRVVFQSDKDFQRFTANREKSELIYNPKKDECLWGISLIRK